MERNNDGFTYGIGATDLDDAMITALHFGGGNITLVPIKMKEHRAMGILFRENDGTVEVGDIPKYTSLTHPDDIPSVTMVFDNAKSIDVVIGMLKNTKIRLADTLGERLLLMRKEAGLSIYKAADKSGLTVARLNSLEIKRSTNLTLDEAKALGALYKAPTCFMTEFNPELTCCDKDPEGHELVLSAEQDATNTEQPTNQNKK